MTPKTESAPLEARVIRCNWLSSTGQVVVIAIGHDNREVARMECDETTVDDVAGFLWQEVYRREAARVSTKRHRRQTRPQSKAGDAQPLALVR